MDKAQAAREARSLTAEWMHLVRITDTAWRDYYTPADLARVDAALDQLYDHLDAAGPSLFHRMTPEQRKAATRERSEWPPFRR